jgi:hypothetical protein
MTGEAGATDPLDSALEQLVQRGDLTDAQARAVRHEVAVQGTSGAAASRQAFHSPARAGASRLPEALGYLGGTFVVAAALLVLGWTWEEFSFGTQLLVLLVATVATLAVGLLVVAKVGTGRASIAEPMQAPRRRLAGVFLVAGAFLAAGAVALVGDHESVDILIPVSVTALLLSCLAVWLAPGILPTLGAFAASLMLVVGVSDQLEDLARLVLVGLYLLVGVIWVLAGPPLTRTRTSSLALGLATLVGTGWWAAAHTVYEPVAGDLGPVTEPSWGESAVSPIGFAVLGILVILGIALYLMGRAWPWLASGAAAAAVLIFQLAGDALGPALASLVVGVVLLAASALLLIGRNRERPTDSGSAVLVDQGI